jgi:hypothetical protein
VLAVGDSTKLEIIFNTGRYKSRVSKRPSIQTNEGPPNKHVQITSQVTERPDSTYPIIIQPYKIDLSQFSEKIIKKKDFMITNVSDQKLEMSLVGMPDDLFEIKLPKSIKPGEDARGKLELKKEAYNDSFEKSVTIEVVGVKDSDTTRFTVPVKRSLHVAKTTPPQKTGSEKKKTP